MLWPKEVSWLSEVNCLVENRVGFGDDGSVSPQCSDPVSEPPFKSISSSPVTEGDFPRLPTTGQKFKAHLRNGRITFYVEVRDNTKVPLKPIPGRGQE